MLDAANVASLGTPGRVFCLVASAEQILARVLGDGTGPVRPLLAGDDPRQRIIELLAERKPGYGRFPQVRTDGLSPTSIVDQLVEMLSSDSDD
jgi:shikimate kinase